MKRSILVILGAAAVSIFSGCSSAPVALGPVGPDPMGFQTGAGAGQLEVFSALSGHGEGNNPTWYRHTDYEICNRQGQRVEHVHNSLGHYSQRPVVVTLSAGEYIVKARAKGALRANVPVVIKPGELTSVHLDGAWQPTTSASESQLVTGPAGYPVGWRADAQ